MYAFVDEDGGVVLGDVVWYVKNVLGDIQGLYSETYQQLDAYYTYDAWGLPTLHAGPDICGLEDEFRYQLYQLTNQLTYRGYFYDFETGLYYLQSRYYSPTWSRFINADKHFDTQDGILGTNMFIYCHNNPVSYTDPSGEAATILFQLDLTISTSNLTVKVGQSLPISITKALYYERVIYDDGSYQPNPPPPIDVVNNIANKDVSWCGNNEDIAVRFKNDRKTNYITGKKVGTTSIWVQAQYDRGVLHQGVNSKGYEIKINVVAGPTYGNGGSYVKQGFYMGQDCCGYALKVKANSSLNPKAGSTTTAENRDQIIACIKNTNSNVKNIREISAFDTPIESNEYRIAVRVSITQQ